MTTRKMGLMLMVLGTLGLLTVLSLLHSQGGAPKHSAPKILDNFQTVVVAVHLMKESALEPDSFKLRRAIILDNGDACLEYTARNGFGGLSVGRAQVVMHGPESGIKNLDSWQDSPQCYTGFALGREDKAEHLMLAEENSTWKK